MHIFKIARIKYKDRTISLGAAFIIVLVVIGTTNAASTSIVQKRARIELNTFLNQSNLTIIKDRKIVDSIYGKNLINELKSIKEFTGHHSYTTKETSIIFYSKNDTLNLVLKKDSEIKTEYWIYWDKYYSTQIVEFGRINTTILNKKR